MRLFSILFPVFAIIGLGWWYGRGKRLDLGVTNQIAMDVLVPALVFAALASKSFDLTRYGQLALGGVAVVLGSGLLAYPFARLFKIQVKTFVPPMMFNNSGNMGIPLMVLAFGDAALAGAVVVFLVEMFLHFSLGAYMLDHRMRLAQLLRTPVMIATLLGIAFSLSGFSLPTPLHTAVKMVGDASIPVRAGGAPERSVIPGLAHRLGRRSAMPRHRSRDGCTGNTVHHPYAAGAKPVADFRRPAAGGVELFDGGTISPRAAACGFHRAARQLGGVGDHAHRIGLCFALMHLENKSELLFYIFSF